MFLKACKRVSKHNFWKIALYKITEGTDKMIEQFKLIVEEHPDIDDYKIRQIEVGDATDCVRYVCTVEN